MQSSSQHPKLEYPAVALTAIDRLLAEQLEHIWAAAELIVDAHRRGGILQAFGTGHSRIVTLELSGRAGGLASVGMIAVKDLVMFGGTDPSVILDPTYEREPGIADRLYELASPRPADAFVIVSNSGINGSVVEMARLVTERGHRLVAITSRAHSAAVPSRDVSAAHLADYADVVIDNGAPAGDAALEIAAGARIGAISSITGVMIAQLITEAVCRLLLESGESLPVFLSANLPQGDEQNASLWAEYRDRIRPIEP